MTSCATPIGVTPPSKDDPRATEPCELVAPIGPSGPELVETLAAQYRAVHECNERLRILRGG